jgi:hypothetical protein
MADRCNRGATILFLLSLPLQLIKNHWMPTFRWIGKRRRQHSSIKISEKNFKKIFLFKRISSEIFTHVAFRISDPFS